MLEPWILCHLNSFGTGKQTPEDSRFWPLSNFDEGQLLLTLKDRTGPDAAAQSAEPWGPYPAKTGSSPWFSVFAKGRRSTSSNDPCAQLLNA
jgi:hypothetical protein